MKIGIFGGNGFVGSAIARKAVAKGWNVVSFSRSGKAFQTPAGHTPSWVEKVRLALASLARESFQTHDQISTGRVAQRNRIRPFNI